MVFPINIKKNSYSKVILKTEFRGGRYAMNAYYIHVRSWNDENKLERLQVTKRKYNQIEENKTIVEILTKPGRFGFEWKKAVNLNLGTNLRIWGHET